jgi:phosphonate transport system substrate-binding protein
MTGRLSAALLGDPIRRIKVYRIIAYGFLAVGFILFLFAGDCFSEESTKIHVGFSSKMFTDVNDNDVKAALKVWAQVLFKERGLPVDPEMIVLNGTGQITHALRNKQIDAFAITTDEYWPLEKEIQPSKVVVSDFDGSIYDEYVLLVHRDSKIQRLADLRGRGLAFLVNPRTSLAPAWLDTLLLKDGLEPFSVFFGHVTEVSKFPRAILPVFFRQIDACVVTRRGLKTMSELNPQVGVQLKVIASSPEVVPAGFFFRPGFSSGIKERMLEEFGNIHKTVAGQQALTIFQSGKLQVQPISVLNNALQILADHKRLSAGWNSEKKTKPGAGQAKPQQ